MTDIFYSPQMQYVGRYAHAAMSTALNILNEHYLHN